MSSSATPYRGNWIEDRDGKIAVWMYLAAAEIVHAIPQEDWMQDAARHWRNYASIGGGGFLSAAFEEYALDDRRRDILLTVAEGVFNKLLAFGEKVPKDFLNAITMGGRSWLRDVDAEVFAKTARGFVNLLHGDLSAHDDAIPVHRDGQQ